MSEFNPQDPPHLFAPPSDMAHDVYSLSDHVGQFEATLYQDIQQDQLAFDSFQRWPYLFSLAMNDDPP